MINKTICCWIALQHSPPCFDGRSCMSSRADDHCILRCVKRIAAGVNCFQHAQGQLGDSVWWANNKYANKTENVGNCEL